MEFIQWDNSLATGIALIDAQNKTLINKANKLYENIYRNDFKEKLNELLGELFEYTEYHFDMEEELLNKYEYPEKSNHIEEHENFRNYIRSYLNETNRDDLMVATNILVYLNTWITHHIKEIDAQCACYLNEKNDFKP